MGLSSGEKFGRYAIERAIGQGGMGQVFRAEDTVLSRIVALKIMRPELTDREQAVARFHREARLAAQLTHPNAIHIYDLGEVGQTLYIAMEYVEGKPLTAYCNDGAATVSQKLTWMLGVARALAAAHKVGLLHRDVKPANIMVSESGIAKVVDFGLAKGELPKVEGRPHYQTKIDHVVGTPEFMAPEQLDAQPLDGRADQFAWGLTMHALFLGYGPRRGDPFLKTPIVRLDAPPAHVSSRVASVVARALEIDKSRRFETMAALADALESAISTVPTPVGAVRVIVSVPPPDPAPVQVVVTSGVRAGSDAQKPKHWQFKRAEVLPGAPFRGVAFSPNGGEVVGFGDDVFRSFRSQKWKHGLPTPDWLHGADIRCVAVEDDGTVHVGGVGALACKFRPNGSVERWRTATGNPREADIHGVDVDSMGRPTFVGSDAKGRAVLATVENGFLVAKVLDAPGPLSCTARLLDGRRIVAGPPGVIGVVSGAGDLALLANVPQATFRSAVADGDRVYIVGTGGHCVWTNGNRFVVEPVETTTDLRTVHICPADGTLWTASDRARIMRRNDDGVWKTMSGLHKSWEAQILAIAALKWSLRAIASDGSVIEGSAR